jgi:hypothetical protein
MAPDRRVRAWLAAGVIALAAALLVAGAISLRSEKPNLPHEEAGMTGLARRIAALERQQSSPVLPSERRVPSAPGADEPAPLQLGSSDPPAPAPTGFASNDELEQAYEASFLQEDTDPTWARSAEREYSAAIDERLPKASQKLSFECRSQFCRLEVLHDSIDTSNDFLLRLFDMQHEGPLTFSSGGFRATRPVEAAGGKLQFTVYIARPGAELAIHP